MLNFNLKKRLNLKNASTMILIKVHFHNNPLKPNFNPQNPNNKDQDQELGILFHSHKKSLKTSLFYTYHRNPYSRSD